MIEMLNSLAMFIGYCAIVIGILYFFDQRGKDKPSKLDIQIAQINAENEQRFKESDPEGWAASVSARKLARVRNQNRRSEIETLLNKIESIKREMEFEY